MLDRDPILEEELKVRSWKDYEVIEHEDLGGLFLDRLWKRDLVTGEWGSLPVRFRVPSPREVRAQRVLAREIAAKEKLDPEKDPDIFENLDVACLLHIVIRDPVAPFAPLALDPRDLEKRLSKDQLKQAWKKLADYQRLLDPEPADITADQMVALSALIVRERSIRPLRVFDSVSQATYVLSMAELHVISLHDKSSQESSEPSTPDS